MITDFLTPPLLAGRLVPRKGQPSPTCASDGVKNPVMAG